MCLRCSSVFYRFTIVFIVHGIVKTTAIGVAGISVRFALLFNDYNGAVVVCVLFIFEAFIVSKSEAHIFNTHERIWGKCLCEHRSLKYIYITKHLTNRSTRINMHMWRLQKKTNVQDQTVHDLQPKFWAAATRSAHSVWIVCLSRRVKRKCTTHKSCAESNLFKRSRLSVCHLDVTRQHLATVLPTALKHRSRIEFFFQKNFLF